MIPIWDVVISQVGNKIGDHSNDNRLENSQHTLGADGLSYDIIQSDIDENWESSYMNKENRDSAESKNNAKLDKPKENRDSHQDKANTVSSKFLTSEDLANSQTTEMPTTEQQSMTSQAEIDGVSDETKTGDVSDETKTGDVSDENWNDELPYYESDIDKLSPDNYDYYENNDDYSYSDEIEPISKEESEEVEPKSNSAEQRKIVKTKVKGTRRERRKHRRKQKVITTAAPTKEIRTTPQPTLNYLTVYLRDLLNPRFTGSLLKDMTRAKGREVPLTKKGFIDFPKLTRNLPFSTKNMLRKRLPMMNKNLKIIKAALRKEHQANMAANARQLPPLIDGFNYKEQSSFNYQPVPNMNLNEIAKQATGLVQNAMPEVHNTAGRVDAPVLLPQTKINEYSGPANVPNNIGQEQFISNQLPLLRQEPPAAMHHDHYNPVFQPPSFINEQPPDIRGNPNGVSPFQQSVYDANPSHALDATEMTGELYPFDQPFEIPMLNANTKPFEDIAPKSGVSSDILSRDTKRVYAHERDQHAHQPLTDPYPGPNMFTEMPSFTPYDAIPLEPPTIHEPLPIEYKNPEIPSIYKETSAEAEKYGIYEVEVNLNPDKYIKQDAAHSNPDTFHKQVSTHLNPEIYHTQGANIVDNPIRRVNYQRDQITPLKPIDHVSPTRR